MPAYAKMKKDDDAESEGSNESVESDGSLDSFTEQCAECGDGIDAEAHGSSRPEEQGMEKRASTGHGAASLDAFWSTVGDLGS